MTRLLPLLLLAWPALVPAQAPSGISFDRDPARANEPVMVTINFEAASPVCALWVDFGDGDARHVVVERFPLTLVKHYTAGGSYAVRAEGRGLLRGFSSALPCAGAPRSRTLVVAGPGSATAPSPSPSPAPGPAERPAPSLPPVIDMTPRAVPRPGTAPPASPPPAAATPAPAPVPAPAPGPAPSRSRDDSLRVF